MAKKFQRTIEDFICEHCQAKVKGNGYTNHCSRCLWSKHVDVNPGDRLSACKGMMLPMAVETKNQEYIIIHKCEICGHKKRNLSAPEDDFDDIIKLTLKDLP